MVKIEIPQRKRTKGLKTETRNSNENKILGNKIKKRSKKITFKEGVCDTIKSICSLKTKENPLLENSDAFAVPDAFQSRLHRPDEDSQTVFSMRSNKDNFKEGTKKERLKNRKKSYVECC